MHFTRPLVSGNSAFRASRLSPWMTIFSLPLSSSCWPALIIAVPTFQYPKRYFLMMVDHLIFPIHSSVGMGVLLLGIAQIILRANCFLRSACNTWPRKRHAAQ